MPYEPAPWMRVELLRSVVALGLRAGSTVIVGLPGQTCESLADELLQFHALGIGTLAITPYLAAAGSARARAAYLKSLRLGDQAPNDARTVHKIVALARLVLPTAIIPSPYLRGDSKENSCSAGLCRGANAVMIDLTPCEHADVRFTNACSLLVARPCQDLICSHIEEISRLVRPSSPPPQLSSSLSSSPPTCVA
jgi:biotin synthase